MKKATLGTCRAYSQWVGGLGFLAVTCLLEDLFGDDLDGVGRLIVT